jgi:prevent-host-death family protein
MAAIPQRQLRNDISDVLRRAESGERIVITVSGREVAELGPVPTARFVDAARARAALAGLPRTSGLLDDLRESGGGLVDPFA